MVNKMFPFAMDAEKVKEMFSFEPSKFQDMFKLPEFDKLFDATKLPGVDAHAVTEAMKKNVEAVVEANKIAAAGYQDVYKKQVALFEAALAAVKDQMAEIQGQPVSAETATKNIEVMKTAYDKALGDLREMTELVQKANLEAFEVVKARIEEIVAEIKAATEKLAA